MSDPVERLKLRFGSGSENLRRESAPVKCADIVIKNNSGEDELEKEVSALLEKIGEIIKCQGRKK